MACTIDGAVVLGWVAVGALGMFLLVVAAVAVGLACTKYNDPGPEIEEHEANAHRVIV